MLYFCFILSFHASNEQELTCRSVAAADPMRRRETFSSLAMEIDDGNGTTSLSSGSSFVPGADEDRSDGSEMAEVHNDRGWGRQIQRQFLY